MWQSSPVNILPVLLAATLAAGAEAAQTQAAATTADRAAAFLAALQDAVGRRDKQAVSSMVAFPAAMHVTGMEVPLQGRLSFLKLYDTIFTAELEEMLALSGVRQTGRPAPKYPLTVTPDGLTVGNAIWARRAAGSFKITRFVIPPSSANKGLQHPPIKVGFYSDQRPAQFAGLLMKRQETQPYVVRVTRGRTIEATIDRFRANDVVVHVEDPSGRPVAAQSREGARKWVGVAPETGDYQVQVVRMAPTDTGTLSYELSIILR
jgi:hypothetical protein